MLQFCLSLKKAHDMTAGDQPLEVSVGDDRQLVYVFAGHQFKCLDRGSFRCNSAHLTEGAHHALHSSLRPAVAIDFLYLMGRDQAGYLVILHDDETATSGTQHILVDKILQA